MVCPKSTPSRLSACANSFFADVISYDEVMLEEGEGLQCLVSLRGGKSGQRRERCVKREAETGVKQPQAKESQGYAKSHQGLRAGAGPPPEPSAGARPHRQLDFSLLAPEQREDTFLSCSAVQLVAPVTAAPGELLWRRNSNFQPPSPGGDRTRANLGAHLPLACLPGTGAVKWEYPPAEQMSLIFVTGVPRRRNSHSLMGPTVAGTVLDFSRSPPNRDVTRFARGEGLGWQSC